MFKQKKTQPKRKSDLSQLGLLDIPDDFDPSVGYDDNDDIDSDLEAELAAITSANDNDKPKPSPRKKKLAVPEDDLNKMIAESLKDINSDEELSGDEEDDPELLGELQELTGDAPTDQDGDENSPVAENTTANEDNPPQLFLPTSTQNVGEIIRERINMYEKAEANAKVAGESMRARRFGRGLKTLMDLLKQVNAGKKINVDDIPPEVSVKTVAPTTVPEAEEKPEVGIVPSETNSEVKSSPESEPEKVNEEKPPLVKSEGQSTPEEESKSSVNSKLEILNARKQEYKIAALEAKKSGDMDTAMQFVKVLKQFDTVIKAAEEGQKIDLSDMPPHPNEFKAFLDTMAAQSNQAAPASSAQTADTNVSKPTEPEESQATDTTAPTSMLEALEQRLKKYQSVKAAAENEGNASKARRFGRIVKQYEDAIKLHKAGKPIPVDDLPTPPGFGPLPTEGTASTKQSDDDSKTNDKPSPQESSPSPTTSTGSNQNTNSPKKPPRKQEQSSRVTGNQISTNLAERQMQILLERQKEFKLAALEAKKAGEIEQAKEYLKIYKGFEKVLNAASMGLPVEMNSLPIPPSQRENLEDSFAVVGEEDVEMVDDISDLGVRLEEQLAKQLMMCKNTRDHHKALGDIAGTNRFENLALSVQKDLDLIRYARKKKLQIPKFHYEKRSFNIVHCITDLTDNELEINVIRGISYNVPNPKDVDTYVKIEFPYPQDAPYQVKTPVVKNTDSPDYDQKYKVEIQRNNRQCQRIFKRQGVKFEVYSKGCCIHGDFLCFPMCFSGFFRSDSLIGTANVKLQPLETKCEIHDTFGLMDGRKAVGGKLEVKIRVRNPILTKQIEHINEKWLVLGD